MIDYGTVLPKGKANAISGADLTRQLGFSSDRALRKDIERARASGQIILSSSCGYFLPNDKAEAVMFYHQMKMRAITTFRNLKSTRKYLNSIYGQESLDDVKEIT